MKNIKISIIGCSVAIRVRPPVSLNNKNYGQILSESLSEKYDNHCISIVNRGLTRATVKDIYPHKMDNFISDYPDYFILNIGIPDASTREMPRFISNLLTYKSNLQFVIILHFLYSKLIQPYIKFFVLLRGKRTWVNEKEFEKIYGKIIEYIQKETNANIIILPINNPSQRIENKLPGTIKNVKRYNEIIKDLSQKYNTSIVDISDLEQTEHFPDGVHYSIEGHKIISNKILDFINL